MYEVRKRAGHVHMHMRMKFVISLHCPVSLRDRCFSCFVDGELGF